MRPIGKIYNIRDMVNFDFKRSSRKCYQTQREIKPGEEFHSALIELANGTVERQDFCAEQWDGEPEHCLGSWKSKVPELGKGRVYWAPKPVLVSYFEHVLGEPNSTDVAYVMALLLMQKKILTNEDNGGDDSVLVLRNRSTKTDYQVKIVDVADARLAQIQSELAERLFMDQLVEPDAED